MKTKIILLLGALAVLVGCSSAPAQPYAAPDYEVAALCGSVAQPVTRADDSMCPIGDGDVPGYPFKWYYADLPTHHWYSPWRDDDIDVVLVGYPIDTHVYVYERPARVKSALKVNRGYPATCTCAPGTTSVKTTRKGEIKTVTAQKKTTTVASPKDEKITRQGSDTVTRGGLGVQAKDRATNAPQPSRVDKRTPTSRPTGTKSGPSGSAPKSRTK